MTAPGWPEPRPVAAGPVELAVYDHGPPTGGSHGDLVVLHGMADVARSLEPLTRSLTDRYRVVAYDARGHGRSTHPGAYSALHYVADLASVVAELGLERPVLIGHSLGGHTAANYAGLYPDRVRAVVLLEGLGPPVNRAIGAEATLERGRAMIEVLRATPRHRPRPDVAAAADRLQAAHPRLDRERAMVLAEDGTKPTPDGGRVWRHDERTWDWIASVEQRELEVRWAAIAAPILAVSGAEAWETWWARPGGPSSGQTPMTAAEFADRLAIFADLEHVELPEAGHMVHFDQPERIDRLVTEFLRRRVESG